MEERPEDILIGFVGQGWVGKSYADDFEQRGFKIVRYAKEPPHEENNDKIAQCDIVFIAVPTPTTPEGFDLSVLRSVIPLVGEGKVAVIKSTILPGTTKNLQEEHPKRIIIHSPEFLSKKTALEDVQNPSRNIIGVAEKTEAHLDAAQKLLKILRKAPFHTITTAEEAELIKYAHNLHGYIQIVFSNLLYDVALHHNMDWDAILQALKANPMMSKHYLDPLHQSGRGAGGHCFIKDFEAFLQFFKETLKDEKGVKALEALRDKNLDLLKSTGKDLHVLKEVYGEI